MAIYSTSYFFPHYVGESFTLQLFADITKGNQSPSFDDISLATLKVLKYDGEPIIQKDSVTDPTQFNYNSETKTVMVEFVPADTANIDVGVYNLELTLEFTGSEVLEFVYAGALQILRKFERQPVINLKQGSTDIANGASPGYDFGNIAVSSTSPVVIFTIENLSAKYDLVVNNVAITGDDSDFEFTSQVASPVVPLGSTEFTLQFTPMSLGLKTITVTISNNDFDQNPYTFTVIGTGV